VVATRDAPIAIRDQLQWTGEALWRKRQCLGCRRLYQTSERITSPSP